MSEVPPRVIACIPSYNSEKFIERTLQSIINQSYENFRVLISDDCSTDNTVTLIRSFIKNDDRFSLFEQKKNLGWIDNVNFLLEKAASHGKYLFILPHDDCIEVDYILKLTKALEENPSAVLSYSDMEVIHSGGKKIMACPGLHGIENKIDHMRKLLNREKWWWSAYRGIARSEVVRTIIPIKKNMFGHKDFSMDWIWLIKLSLYGKFIRVPEILYTKYFGENNLSYQLKHTTWNYLGNTVTGSRVLWQSPLTKYEQLTFQRMIFVLILKRLVIGSGTYAAAKWLKAKLFQLFLPPFNVQ
jgi:glycosyltransferase involved in cell wall biosynthesis